MHVVICDESWEEVASDSPQVMQKTSRHAGISSQPLSRDNVHERCNLGARHRWGIETSFLVEQRPRYQYEHCFSENWDAMRGDPFRMRLGPRITIRAQNIARLAKIARSMGLRGLIYFLLETYSNPWLDAEKIRPFLAAPCQLRLE